MTVIVGEKIEGTTCTVTTLAETVGDQRTVSFENPSNGTPAGQDAPSTNGSTLPSWASYVKGVASCYTGMRLYIILLFDACATLIHALIGTRLDYCNLLLYNIADAKVEKLQKVQNQAARILTRSPRRDHITPVLKQLHWLKVHERIRYKVLILAHKSFYETAPQYFSALVTRKDYVKNTRSSTDHYLLCTPPLSKDCSNTFLERSFFFLLLASGIT